MMLTYENNNWQTAEPLGLLKAKSRQTFQQQQSAFVISWEFISWKDGRGARRGFGAISLFNMALKKANVILTGVR